MRNVSDKSCRETRNTHCVFSNFFLPRKSCFYEIMWENIAERGRPQMTKWRMRIACWISKATNTHTHTHKLCNNCSFSTATMVTRTRLNVTLYEHCLYSSAHYDILNILWKSDVRYLIYNSRPPMQDTPSSHFFKIYFNIILPSMPRFSKWPLSLRLSRTKPCMHLYSPHTSSMPHSSMI